jgi:hypothetical protein
MKNEIKKNFFRLDQFRIMVFGSHGKYKSMMKTGQPENTTVLAIYFDGQHFDAISSIRMFFGLQKGGYCLSCETPFQSKMVHRMSCATLCVSCRQHGLPPCTPNDNGGGRSTCTDCQQIFPNQECFQRHKKNKVCQRFRRCPNCGVTWDFQRALKGACQMHQCDHRFCQVCKTYHTKERGCFIEPVNRRKSNDKSNNTANNNNNNNNVGGGTTNCRKRRHQSTFSVQSSENEEEEEEEEKKADASFSSARVRTYKTAKKRHYRIMYVYI